MPSNPLPAQLASQAETIVNTLVETKYQFAEAIDADAGSYDCDCSSFVSFVLDQLAPRHYALIPKEPGKARPRAFKFHDFFASLPSGPQPEWRRVDTLADAARGDILAWRFADIVPHHDTGHVVFLAEAPTVDEAGVWSVRVYDSADGPHFEDTRGPGEGRFPNGVGSGFLKFRVDSAGRPTAFLFAPSDHYVTLPISIGRAEPASS